MKISNCPKCGFLFNRSITKVCPNCGIKAEKTFSEQGYTTVQPKYNIDEIYGRQ